MKIKIFLIFIIFFLNTSSFAINIRVLDLQNLIENNSNLLLLYELIDKDQILHKEKFKNEEIFLQNEFIKIEELNLILEPTELQREIESYNLKLNNLNENIEKFNLHYEIQINNLKNRIINLILDQLKKYSEDNKIDLILDSNNYILSSNSINITDKIEDMINEMTIEINFEKY